MTDLTPHAREAEPPKNGRGARKDADRAKAQGQFLEMLAKGVTASGAAKAAGVTRQAAYLWRDGNADFAAQWDEHVKIGVESVEDIVKQHAIKDWRAAEAWLRAHARNKWGQHVQTDQSLTITEAAKQAVKAEAMRELLDSIDGQGRSMIGKTMAADEPAGDDDTNGGQR